MSRDRRALGGDLLRFPRVSGDEPQSASGAEQPQKFSPRERG